MKKKILDTIQDTVTDFTFYRRKRDEELSIEKLQNAVSTGQITVKEMSDAFNKHLVDTFTCICGNELGVYRCKECFTNICCKCAAQKTGTSNIELKICVSCNEKQND